MGCHCLLWSILSIGLTYFIMEVCPFDHLHLFGPPALLASGNHQSAVCICLFYFFFDPTYKTDHTVFVFL